MITAGVGPLAIHGTDRLRALGTLPQRDRLVTCAGAALGVSSMDQLAERLSELRIATSPDDGVNMIGLAAHRQLAALGVEPDKLISAGGSFLYSERPFPAIAAFSEGAANVLIHEAIMTPSWQRIADHRRVAYLDAEPTVLSAFNEWQWPSAVVPQDFLPELDRDLTAIDFSDFLVLCTADLPDEVASLIAWCMVATRNNLEVQYRHLAPDRSPITYPLDPQAIASAPIALHPSAAATYAAMQHDERSSDALMWA
jgi:TRAP-type uncharacterized transport system substrate-binding protein